jgi:hypothetical protein
VVDRESIRDIGTTENGLQLRLLFRVEIEVIVGTTPDEGLQAPPDAFIRQIEACLSGDRCRLRAEPRGAFPGRRAGAPGLSMTRSRSRKRSRYRMAGARDWHGPRRRQGPPVMWIFARLDRGNAQSARSRSTAVLRLQQDEKDPAVGGAKSWEVYQGLCNVHRPDSNS